MKNEETKNKIEIPKLDLSSVFVPESRQRPESSYGIRPNNRPENPIARQLDEKELQKQKQQ